MASDSVMTNKMNETPIVVRRYNNRSDVVKLSFSQNYTYRRTGKKNLRCNINIGNEIVHKLRWCIGDSIDILRSNEGLNNYIFLRKNIPNDDKVDMPQPIFKLRSVRNSYSSVITIPCFFQVEDKKIKEVRHEIVSSDDNQHGLKIYYEEKKHKIINEFVNYMGKEER